jgi:hypothetical protein
MEHRAGSGRFDGASSRFAAPPGPVRDLDKTALTCPAGLTSARWGRAIPASATPLRHLLASYTDLEEQPQEKFGLRDAVAVAVAVAVDGARGQVVPALGAATAQYLSSTLMGGEVLGVSSWSATLLAAAEAMPSRTGSPLDRWCRSSAATATRVSRSRRTG